MYDFLGISDDGVIQFWMNVPVLVSLQRVAPLIPRAAPNRIMARSSKRRNLLESKAAHLGLCRTSCHSLIRKQSTDNLLQKLSVP